MKLNCICEDTINAIFRRLVNYMRNTPNFGPGVNPKTWGEVEEVIDAKGTPKFDFEEERKKAEELLKRAETKSEKEAAEEKIKAIDIYRKISDRNPKTGLREKSFYSRVHNTKNEEHHLHVVIDIDNLKYLNSKLGHLGADDVLIKFGEMLENHIEHGTNEKFGKISKVYHRSGDEFNAIINLDKSNSSEEETLLFVINKCAALLKEFSSKSFKSEKVGGEARATATIGIGFDLESIDIKIDKIKHTRRKKLISALNKEKRREIKNMPHIVVGQGILKITDKTSLKNALGGLPFVI